MQIENGRFYFINDNFIKKYGEKYNLMMNKKIESKRPCYFCFKDKKDENIIWFVPISRQYEKYKSIYDKKKQKIKREPLNFVFGVVKDENATFLIQNIFPTIQKYIEEKYQVQKHDITVSAPLQKEIIEKAENILRLETKGVRIAFSDLVKFKQDLLNEDK
jgi:hypothetical protein